MEVENDLQAMLNATADCPVDERHSTFIQSHVSIEELHLIDGETDVVEPVRGQQFDILFGEYLLALLSHDPALGEPVADVDSLGEIKFRSLVLAAGQCKNDHCRSNQKPFHSMEYRLFLQVITVS